MDKVSFTESCTFAKEGQLNAGNWSWHNTVVMWLQAANERRLLGDHQQHYMWNQRHLVTCHAKLWTLITYLGVCLRCLGNRLWASLQQEGSGSWMIRQSSGWSEAHNKTTIEHSFITVIFDSSCRLIPHTVSICPPNDWMLRLNPASPLRCLEKKLEMRGRVLDLNNIHSTWHHN